jgi:hypothetical protein
VTADHEDLVEPRPPTSHENKAARQTDGTDRLCMAVYGRPAKPRDYIGGANAQMLCDAADMINALRTMTHDLPKSSRKPSGQ